MQRIWQDSPSEATLIIDGAEHNHIARVLRAKAGDEITVISGDEFDRRYKITQINKKQTALHFVSKAKNQCNPTKPFVVYLSAIKNDAMSLAVQKLNEIGATELKLFSSEFTAVSVKQINIPRLNEIARQSCKQCGRSIPMRVSFIKDIFAEVACRARSRVLFFDEKPARPVKTSEAPIIDVEAIIVGSEGGFSDGEREKLFAIATPVNFGSRILRAETAAIVGASKWCI